MEKVCASSGVDFVAVEAGGGLITPGENYEEFIILGSSKVHIELIHWYSVSDNLHETDDKSHFQTQTL